MAEDNVYFFAHITSDAGEATFFHGSPTMVNYIPHYMQDTFHLLVVPSQNSSLPTVQKGIRKHRDLLLTLYCLGPEVIGTLAQTSLKEAEKYRGNTCKHVIFSE